MIERVLTKGEPDGDGRLTLARTLVVIALLLGLWTAFGLLSAVHFFFQEGADARFGETASHVVVFYWGWAILTPAVVLLTRRLTHPRHSIWSRAALMTLLAAAVIAVHGLLYASLVRLLGVDSQARIDLAGLESFAVRHGGGDLATFAVIVGACLLFDASRRERKRALASAALQGRLARAELEVLRWQLHPHFLFNALNTVSTLVLKGDGNAADRAIGLISVYLRDALEQRPDALVTLREELATVRRYVDVERLRFGDALTVQESVEAAALNAYVPGLILQPLVENAIRHGVGRIAGEGSIKIVAAVQNGRLRIDVINPSVDVPADTRPAAKQFGLRYVRERLEQFFRADASFQLSLNESESIATLDLPLVTINATVASAGHRADTRAPAA